MTRGERVEQASRFVRDALTTAAAEADQGTRTDHRLRRSDLQQVLADKGFTPGQLRAVVARMRESGVPVVVEINQRRRDGRGGYYFIATSANDLRQWWWFHMRRAYRLAWRAYASTDKKDAEKEWGLIRDDLYKTVEHYAKLCGYSERQVAEAVVGGKGLPPTRMCRGCGSIYTDGDAHLCHNCIDDGTTMCHGCGAVNRYGTNLCAACVAEAVPVT